MQNQLNGRRLRVTAGGFNGRKKVAIKFQGVKIEYYILDVVRDYSVKERLWQLKIKDFPI